MEVLELLVAHLVASLPFAFWGSTRKIGFWWSLFWCFFLSPVLAACIISFSDKKEAKFQEVSNSTDLNDNK